MAVRRRKRQHQAVEMQMGPMIDMVFLLLVFFMVTAKPIDPESDISLGLPGTVAQTESVELPDEQRIEILADGRIVLNELELAAANDVPMPRVVTTLTRLKESADLNRAEALVTIDAHNDVPHQRVVDVFDACAKAGITGMTFAGAQPES
ncbi:MAG: biopolymer transporter ExbD [Verrucomicrobiae bacterium]|nr:biopolymer transporter ExbD [Verrucomicrobiae bacterium]